MGLTCRAPEIITAVTGLHSRGGPETVVVGCRASSTEGPWAADGVQARSSPALLGCRIGLELVEDKLRELQLTSGPY